MPFDVLYADPPWRPTTYSEKGRSRAPDRHYYTLTPATIAALPVERLAAKDAVLFLWTTYPFLEYGMETLKAWGFSFRTVVFTWVKCWPGDGRVRVTDWPHGNGHYTLANPEIVLLGRRGRGLKRHATNVRNLIVAPRLAHSAKPPETYGRIERLFGHFGRDGQPLQRVELFARGDRRIGWTKTGLESDGVEVRDFIAQHIT